MCFCFTIVPRHPDTERRFNAAIPKYYDVKGDRALYIGSETRYSGGKNPVVAFRLVPVWRHYLPVENPSAPDALHQDGNKG